jgi:hypothetical protein
LFDSDEYFTSDERFCIYQHKIAIDARRRQEAATLLENHREKQKLRRLSVIEELSK